VLGAAMPKIKQFERDLPHGYQLIFAGEYREQTKGFADLSIAMISSVVGIYLALVLQFRHAVKPLVVFTAIPFGLVGALAALYIMHEPFGFTAFLGIASLIGVIVSHTIVLSDFIEERREMGESLRESLLDAGILRLRPVLITGGRNRHCAHPAGFARWSITGAVLLRPGGRTANLDTRYPAVSSDTLRLCCSDLKWIKWESTKHTEAERPFLAASTGAR
jgi:AcrB/AcrD/AcrF family